MDQDQKKLPRKVYERELLRLQEELVVMAEWVRRTGARVAIIFEGRGSVFRLDPDDLVGVLFGAT